MLTDPANGDSGEPDARWARVLAELRAVAARALSRERPDHTLQPTALVNEVYLKLAEQPMASTTSREQFLATAARMMRHILVDHARAHGAQKRRGPRDRLTISCGGSRPHRAQDYRWR